MLEITEVPVIELSDDDEEPLKKKPKKKDTKPSAGVIDGSAAQNSEPAAQNPEPAAQNPEPAAQNFAESAAQSPSLAACITSIFEEIVAEAVSDKSVSDKSVSDKSAAQTQKLAAQTSEEPTTTKAAAAPVTEIEPSAATLKMQKQLDDFYRLKAKMDATKKLRAEQEAAEKTQEAERMRELQSAIVDLDLSIATLKTAIAERNAQVKTTNDSSIVSTVRADHAKEVLIRIISAQDAAVVKLQSAQEQVAKWTEEHARLHDSMALSAAQLGAAQKALATLTKEHQEIIAQLAIDELEKQIDNETDEGLRTETRALLDAARAIVSESDSEATQLKAQISECESKLEAASQAVVHASEQLGESRTKVAELQTGLSDLTVQRNTAETGLQAANAELIAISERATLLRGEVLAKQDELAALFQKLADAKADLGVLANKLSVANSVAKVELTKTNDETAKLPEPDAPAPDSSSLSIPSPSVDTAKPTEATKMSNTANQAPALDDDEVADYGTGEKETTELNEELGRLREKVCCLSALTVHTDTLVAFCQQMLKERCELTHQNLSDGLTKLFGTIGATALNLALQGKEPSHADRITLTKGGRGKAYICEGADGRKFVIRASATMSRGEADGLSVRLQNIYAALGQLSCLPVVLESPTTKMKFVLITLSPYFGDNMYNVLKSSPGELSRILVHVRAFLATTRRVVPVDLSARNICYNAGVEVAVVTPIDLGEAALHSGLADLNWLIPSMTLLFSGTMTPHYTQTVLNLMLFEPIATIFNDDAVNGNRLLIEASNDGPLVEALARIITPKLKAAFDDAVHDRGLRQSLHDLIFFFLTYMADATSPNYAKSSTHYNFEKYFGILSEQLTEKVAEAKGKEKGEKRSGRQIKRIITENLSPASKLFSSESLRWRSEVADKYVRLLLHITFALYEDAAAHCRDYEATSGSEKDRWHRDPRCEPARAFRELRGKQAGISAHKIKNRATCENFIKALTKVSSSGSF